MRRLRDLLRKLLPRRGAAANGAAATTAPPDAPAVRSAPLVQHWPDDPERRSLMLLYLNQTQAQRTQCIKQRCFEVVGGATGKRYRIGPDLGATVQELDPSGRPIVSLGIFPAGYLPPGDIMLAQKIALELLELDVLKIACRSQIGPRGAGAIHDQEMYARCGAG